MKHPFSGQFDEATNHITFTESPEYNDAYAATRHYDGHAIIVDGSIYGWAGSHSELLLEVIEGGGGGLRRWGFRLQPFTGGWFATIY